MAQPLKNIASAFVYRNNYKWFSIKTLIYFVKFFYHSSLCKNNLTCMSVI